MNINWVDATLRFDPNSPDPFATHGIPLPVYGNYGGPNWSAGQVGGTATIPANPSPVDPLDALFYAHDLVYQSSNLPSVRIPADIQLVLQMQALTYTDPGAANYDPEAGLYEGLSTLGILGQLAAFGVHLPNEQVLVQEAIRNFEAGLAAVPGEAKSLHGALHVFEHKFLDFLVDPPGAPSNNIASNNIAPNTIALFGSYMASVFVQTGGGQGAKLITEAPLISPHDLLAAAHHT